MLILMVEDEALIRQFIGLELIAAGHEVELAGTVDHALLRLELSRKPDALFVDIRLGHAEHDGWFIGERYRAKYPDLPIVFATGHADVHPRPIASSAFLRKPYKSTDVIAALTTLTEPAITAE